MEKETSLYPKVLVVGQTFNLLSGSGITKHNLFWGWPKDRIAVITYERSVLDNQICTNYYLLGDKEEKSWIIYPKKNYSKPIDLSVKKNETRSQKTDTSSSAVIKRKIQKFRNNLIGFLGLHYKAQKSIISKELLEWIDQFKPDCLYTNLHTYSFMKFIEGLVNSRNLPLIIHIMDDWMPSIEPKGILRKYWLRKTDQLFRKLSASAKRNLSICQYMSEEYKKRYNIEFIPFHNCIEFDKWLPVARTSQSFEGKFIVLYAGRIGPGTTSSVTDIAYTVEQLASEGFHIEFQVQSNVIPDEIRLTLEKLKNTKINDYVNYNELPIKFASANLLVLPMDSDEKNLSYIRLSMPTKVPEYMICGTPILVYAPIDTALYNYAAKEGWGLTVTGNDLVSLKTSLTRLYTDKNLREQLSDTANKVARINHNSVLVRKEFQQILFS